jgi:pimeloyl-ACP methyl ester carboxylesterase
MADQNAVVFIHGMFMNPSCWDQWVRLFSDNGFSCSAPPWPYHDGTPSSLRERVFPGLGSLTLGEIVSRYKEILSELPRPPVLIGHSMGGLVVQILVTRGFGKFGVCIDSAPPKGVFSAKWSFLKSNFPTINPFKGNTLCRMTPERFQYTFCNTMSLEETRREFEKFVVPESRNVARSSTGREGYVDFAAPRKPLLFIAGEKDNIIPASLNRRNADAYRHGENTVDFKEFPGRTHFICGQRGWEEVADFCIRWIGQQETREGERR